MASKVVRLNMVLAINKRLHECLQEAEALYEAPGTNDADVNEATVILYHAVQTAKWAAHNAVQQAKRFNDQP